jgi:hypothetical protein
MPAGVLFSLTVSILRGRGSKGAALFRNFFF